MLHAREVADAGVEARRPGPPIIPPPWFPRLMHGSPKERANRGLLGEGDAIEGSAPDEYVVRVEGLLAGRGSGESDSLRRWLDARAGG